ncbi:potassium channel subfamily K member 1-like [Schistocerca americana]|uniref:Potassium channel subfamily K member 1 n=1 Tax=Schistocerca gregaria TaxID=7010 RepID=A0A8E5NIY3_SCHGR|nr:potassium channel subfamily K member 1-like [Schistocerca americana]XP_049804514.1 potassium channel subfamily K member 1-like [Schistocerca nitens]XP_049846077.1 potassium channel subfamily K member 1-like isoform X1 [Schistocerca gregaria]QVD39236.1 K channel subfamily K member [Schistocerca gregaria]
MRHEWPSARPRTVLGVRRSSLLLLLYAAFYCVYLAAGGFAFAALEAPAEDELKELLAISRRRFLDDHPCVTDEALEELIEEVVRASNRGVSAAKNASGEPNWSFGQSLFFSSTVVTTIGYGHVTPLSKGGKVFCMIYAMLGIPLTLVLLTALVERLMVPTTVLLQTLNSRLGHLYQPFNIRLLHLAIVVTVLVAFFMMLPASVFAALEPEWDFLDSLYYCFISLTTVGLGDYIPGDSPNQAYRPLYKVATTGYLLAGLTFMMLTLTVFYDIPQLNFGLFFLMRSDETTGDPEKVRLQTPGTIGPKYTQQLDDGGSGRHAVVRVKSRHDDSPSPEDTTPVHARP